MDETLEAIVEASTTHMTRLHVTVPKLVKAWGELYGVVLKYPELCHPELISKLHSFGVAFEEALEAEGDITNDLCLLLIHNLTPIANP